MRGVVEPRGDDKWRVRVFGGRENGKVRWVSRTIAGTKRQAQVALAELLTEVEAGQATKSHPTSVAEQLDRWLADIEPTRSAYTVKEHRRSSLQVPLGPPENSSPPRGTSHVPTSSRGDRASWPPLGAVALGPGHWPPATRMR
jgi:hypothetical protein